MNKQQIKRLYELERGLHELKKELRGESPVDAVIDQVCKAFKCSRAQIMTDSRLSYHADLRKIIAYHAEQKGCSRREIALMLNRDRATIANAINQYKNFTRNEDPEFLKMIEKFNAFKFKIAA